jgi:hypothetical protein
VRSIQRTPQRRFGRKKREFKSNRRPVSLHQPLFDSEAPYIPVVSKVALVSLRFVNLVRFSQRWHRPHRWLPGCQSIPQETSRTVNERTRARVSIRMSTRVGIAVKITVKITVCGRVGDHGRVGVKRVLDFRPSAPLTVCDTSNAATLSGAPAWRRSSSPPSPSVSMRDSLWFVVGRAPAPSDDREEDRDGEVRKRRERERE